MTLVILRELREAAVRLRQERATVERLTAACFEAGASYHEVGLALDEKPDTVRMRMARRRLRKSRRAAA